MSSRDSSPTRTLRRSAPALALATLLTAASVAGSGCTSVKVERDTLTSGTFRSSAWAFTLLGEDIPRPALMIARSNAADIQRPDLQIETEWVAPDLRWFDWLLDILGFRYAKVTGTWGLPEGSLEAGTPTAQDE